MSIKYLALKINFEITARGTSENAKTKAKRGE